MHQQHLRPGRRTLRRLSLALSLLCAAGWLAPLQRPAARAASAAPPAAQAEAHNVRSFFMPTKDLVVDPTTQTVYASVPSAAGAGGNSIVPIDAAAGSVGAPVFVGSEPGEMAISDDGRYIYVALDGAAAVRRYDVQASAAGLQFPLGDGDGFSGKLFARDLSVMPGNAEVVAASRRNIVGSPDFEGVAVYEGGVQRPKTTPRHTGSDFIEFSSSPATLYGVGFGGVLEKMAVDASGLTVEQKTQTGSGGIDFKFEDGRIYLSSGKVYDAAAGSLVGTFTIPSTFPDFTYLVEPDSSVGRVYFITGAGDTSAPRTVTLRAYSQQTFLPAGTLEIHGVIGNPTSLVRWGANGLAFRTSGNQVFLIRTTLIPSTTPVPPQTPTPTPTATPTPTPTPTPAPGELRHVSITARDIVLDPASGLVYASVPSAAGAGGNSIAPINPVSGTVGASVFVGSEPGRMAISDNSQYIYVSLDGAKAVRRYDVQAGAAGLQFPLGTDPQGGEYTLRDIDVAPGRPETVAVTRRSNFGATGAAVYEEGVARPLATGTFNTTDLVEYSGSSQVLYGLNNSDSESGFRRMGVGACGALVLNVWRNLLGGFNADFKVDGGLAYGASGWVADPEAGRIVGRYLLSDSRFGGSASTVMVDAPAGRVYFLSGFSSPFDTVPVTLRLNVFDQRTFLPVGHLDIPGIIGAPTALVRWGANGLAFRTNKDQVYLLQHPIVAAPGAAPAPAPTPPPPTRTITGQVVAFNIGAVGGVTMSLSGAATGTAVSDAAGNFSFAGLPLCGDYTVTPSPVENYTFEPPSRTMTAASANNPNQATAFFEAVPRILRVFASSTTVGEAAGRVIIRVARGGDVSNAAAVSYRTNDGTASARSDYTAAVGTVRFAPGESFKDVPVFITDDALAEGAETLTVSLSNPTGGLIDSFFSSVTLTVNDNDAASRPSPVGDAAFDPAFFVRQHYLDFFNREPDAAGLNFWVSQITECETRPEAERQGCREVRRINVSGAFFLSIEFQETGFLVYRLHQAAFDTGPRLQFRTFLPDTQRMGRGVIIGQPGAEALLEQNKQTFIDEFVARPEFLARYPADMPAAAFVDALNQNTGGALSQAERDSLVNALASGTTARSQVVRAVAEDADFTAREKNPAFVLMQYFGYFRRNPPDPPELTLDFAGYNFWLQKLNNHGGNFVSAEMVKAFITSGEYLGRFGL